MSASTRRLNPPFNEQPLLDDGRHSQPWNEFHLRTARALDTLDMLPDTLWVGVIDGSDAAPGNVGEFMTATGGAVGLVTAAVTNLASLALTPGDWDVSGYVLFNASAGTHSFFGVGIGTIDTNSWATYPTGAFNQVMPTTLHRVNISAATTVWVVGQAAFTGAVFATGTIRARRMR